MKNSYITSPIYYVNDVPHIGHAYTTIICDTLARYHRLIGNETFFLTGTDEHGQKIEQAAQQRGKSPKEYADEISDKFKTLWDEFDISYDKFIRTTDEKHKNSVQFAFLKMFKKGDIYKGEYEGNYCVSCETFFTENQLINGEDCPDCGRKTSLLKEESYFFKLSKYEKQLLKWYEENDNCIVPRAKKNEVISFVKQGLKDLSITRTSFDWGIKLPEELNDKKHVLYVWLDALLNYISALGYGAKEEKMKFWPANYHIIGKDILRFHSIYWPAFLMSLELPLPKHIAAHGWWTRNGEKMSKSKGNVVSPKEIADAYGLENFRYFMLREVPFGQDGDFSQKALIDRINSDLGNQLGNLLNRIIGMSGKYNDYIVDMNNVEKYHKKELHEANDILKNVEEYLVSVQTNRYLEDLWKVLSLANGSITLHEPWVKIKENKKDEALALVGLVANLLAKVSILLYPIMPKTSEKIANSLNFKIDISSYNELIKDKKILKNFTINQIEPLFPKIDNELIPTFEPSNTKVEEISKEKFITIDDFLNTKIKIGTVIEADAVENSDKLIKFLVDLNEEKPRQILSGIRKYYEPKSLVGTQVCVVTGLKPAKLMGIISEGMILTAEGKNGLSLISPQNSAKNGAIVK